MLGYTIMGDILLRIFKLYDIKKQISYLFSLFYSSFTNPFSKTHVIYIVFNYLFEVYIEESILLASIYLNLTIFSHFQKIMLDL